MRTDKTIAPRKQTTTEQTTTEQTITTATMRKRKPMLMTLPGIEHVKITPRNHAVPREGAPSLRSKEVYKAGWQTTKLQNVISENGATERTAHRASQRRRGAMVSGHDHGTPTLRPISDDGRPPANRNCTTTCYRVGQQEHPLGQKTSDDQTPEDSRHQCAKTAVRTHRGG